MTLRHRFTLIAQRPMIKLSIPQAQEQQTQQQQRWWLKSIRGDELYFECECFGDLPLEDEYRQMMDEIEAQLTYLLSWRGVLDGWEKQSHPSKLWYPRHDGLLEALRCVYEHFVAYPRPVNLNSSPLSPLPEESMIALRSGPLREMSAEHISRYAFKALTTCGDRDDFLHYLPRILEVIIMGDLSYDEGVIISKFEIADFESWPDADRDCVRQVFVHWIADTMHHSAYPSFWDRLVLALGIGAQALSPLSSMKISIFRALEIAEEIYELNQIKVQTLTGLIPFWRVLSNEQSDRLKAWLKDHVLTLLECVALSDLSSSSRASELYEQLEHFLQRWDLHLELNSSSH